MIELPTLEQMTVRADANLRDALAVIDVNAQGACFVVEDGLLVGLLSDGDIRRALIDGATLERPITGVMRRDYVWLPIDTPLEDIQARLTQEIRIIPILNEAGALVDYACVSRYHQVPLIQPVLDGNEMEYVTDCIRTGWISSQGAYVRKFEQAFADFVGAEKALTVSNGTVALHLALVTLGIGPGDEVIVPDLTFAAPVNAVIQAGATPVLVDVDLRTMAMGVAALEGAVTPRTRAIIPVHLYGHPADMRPIMDIARSSGIAVIEDCAEAFGSRYEGAHVGLLGDAATFSFFGNKTITTGEGGMLLFRDAAASERARMLRDHGMSRNRRYWHEHVGYNYRLTNVQAAIGLAQMERAEEFVDRKRWIAAQYRQRLNSLEGIGLPGEFGPVVNSFWLYTVRLPEDVAAGRDQVLAAMKANGIEARPVFHPIHRMPPYATFVGDARRYPISDVLADGGMSLPSGTAMRERDVEQVCDALARTLEHSRVTADG